MSFVPLPVADVPPAPLTCFARGSRACIAWVALEAGEAQRLREMGVREGACVGVVQNGAACVLAVDGCRLALRREVAGQLFATPA